ncbi:MAG: hypothetical protein LBL63_00790, partial [Clostridiales Family XIII bacterium]|nr:hypothetical protein [Clostridiales Family XIII bacterium]
MVHFKKIPNGKKALVMMICLMLVMLSFPFGVNTASYAEGDRAEEAAVLSIDYDDAVVKEYFPQGAPPTNDALIEWLLETYFPDYGTDENPLEGITSITITGALDQAAYAIIGAVYDLQSTALVTDGPVALTTVDVETSAEIDGSWATALSVAGIKFDITLLSGATISNLASLNGYMVDSVTVDKGATLAAISTGGPTMNTVTLNGGTLDLSDITDPAEWSGISTYVAAREEGVISTIILYDSLVEEDANEFLDSFNLSGQVLAGTGGGISSGEYLSKIALTVVVSVMDKYYDGTTRAAIASPPGGLVLSGMATEDAGALQVDYNTDENKDRTNVVEFTNADVTGSATAEFSLDEFGDAVPVTDNFVLSNANEENNVLGKYELTAQEISSASVEIKQWDPWAALGDGEDGDGQYFNVTKPNGKPGADTYHGWYKDADESDAGGTSSILTISDMTTDGDVPTTTYAVGV